MLKVNEIIFGKYRILGLLGRGGMGTVYLAENINVGNRWAIKEIEATVTHHVDLLVEPEMLKRLNHPNLPRIVDVERTASRLYIIEDYFEGQTLQKILENRQLCTEVNVVKWARQLAEILIYLHNLKPIPIIYSDLKPGNIIIDPNWNLKLVDFGIARTQTGSSSQGAFGSRGYAAPEQYLGQFDESTDIFSFGATFFHVLTGRKYDTQHPVSLKEINTSFSEGLNHIISKCLQLDRRQRYQSAADLFKDLKFLDRFNTDYKKSLLRQKLMVFSVVGLVLVGSLVLKFGIDHRENTAATLYQQNVDKGIQLTSVGKYTDAEQAFMDATKYQSLPEVYQNLARLYLRESQPEKAISFINEKMQAGLLKNDTSDAYLLGSAWFDLKDYKKAITYFKQSLQSATGIVNQDYEASMRDLAISYSRINQYSEAEKILVELESKKGTTNPLTKYIRGEISLAKNEFPQAADYFEASITGDPRNAQYMIGASECYSTWSASLLTVSEKIDKLKHALKLAEDAQTIEPYNIQALSDCGRCNFELGQMLESVGDSSSVTSFQEARLSFIKLKDIVGEDSNTYLNLAMVCDKLNDTTSADASFQEALRLDEGSSHANFVYGLFKLKRGEYTAAYKYLQKTVDLNKNSYEVSEAKAKIAELRSKGWI